MFPKLVVFLEYLSLNYSSDKLLPTQFLGPLFYGSGTTVVQIFHVGTVVGEALTRVISNLARIRHSSGTHLCASSLRSQKTKNQRFCDKIRLVPRRSARAFLPYLRPVFCHVEPKIRYARQLVFNWCDACRCHDAKLVCCCRVRTMIGSSGSA